MRSWLGSSLLLATVLVLGCSRSEPAQALAADAKPVPPQATVSAPTKAEGETARNITQNDAAAPKQGAKSGRKFALLVGVTKYDTLQVKELVGPANDVQLMGQMLKSTYGFSAQDIVILADCPGATGRPTRANIKNQFDRLAKEALPGDQMVILFGGHGEQQPEQEPMSEQSRRRSDGLTPIILPCDAGPWDENTKRVNNAISADQMGVWAKALTDRGASVWLIVDACHSATMMRGGGDEVARALPEGSLVPLKALAEARQAAAARAETTRGGPEKPDVKGEKPTPKWMALYACQRDQTAPELTAPVGGTKRHGLLTYTVCQVLCEAKSKLTYRDLRDRVQAKYIAEWDRMYTPVPLMEGSDEDTEVLGAQSLADRSKFLLSQQGGAWTLRAGQLHGLTEKSILAVYPPAGEANADKIVGHVRIRKISPTESEVEPCARDQMPPPKALHEGSRCELVFAEFGSMGMRVAIEGAVKGEGPAHRTAKKMLEEIAKESNGLIEMADDNRPADVFVRVKDDQFYVLPAESAQLAKEPAPGHACFGPITSEQPAKMRNYLTSIARARNLLKIVARGASNESADLKVEMIKFANKLDAKTKENGKKVQAGEKGNVLQPGEWVGWKLTNTGQSRIRLDVTALFIDSQFGISPLFPRRGEGAGTLNRIYPEVSFWVGPFPVQNNTVGMEHLVVIAVKGEGQPIDFTCLAQPTLAATETMRGGDRDPLATPLGRLLKGATFGQGATRDLGAPVEPETQAFRLFSWLVPPAQERAKK